VSYVGFLTKNPLHPEWVVNWHHHEDRDLGDIAAGLRYLPPRPAKQAELAAGFGRNCELFAQTRVPAYRLRRTWTDTPDRFDAAVLELAWLINTDTFAKPLHRTEVAHLAHSVSRWSWRHIDPDPHVFIHIQTRRAIKGTQAAAAQRRIDRNHARKVLAMAAETPKRRSITAKAAAERIGCSPRTVQRIQAEPRTQYDARVKERRELVLSGHPDRRPPPRPHLNQRWPRMTFQNVDRHGDSCGGIGEHIEPGSWHRIEPLVPVLLVLQLHLR